MTAINASVTRAFSVVLLSLALLPGCSDGRTNGSNPPVRDLSSFDREASWRGEMPCADCSGILTTITLFPDGTYRREAAYLGTNGGGDTVAAEIGRWTHDSGRGRVQLQGSMEQPALYAVDANGALRLLDLQGADIASDANYSLAPIAEPIALTHPARITGAFTYFADAATLIECRSGLQYPVDMSAEFPTLQAAYANANANASANASANAQSRVVRVSAHLDNRPAMEGGGTMVALIIDSVHTVNTDDSCAASRTLDSLASRSWRLIAIARADGTPLNVSDSTEAGFRWDREQNRLTGSGGCNNFSSPGIMRGTTLAGTAAAATKRLCNAPGVMEVEQRLFEILASDIAVRIQRDTLVWSHGPRDVARFVPRGANPSV